jgi:nitrogen fixation/metabolism regulation signal transduction histidine kinase
LLEVVSGDIEDILKTSQILHENQMENLKQLQSQTDTITQDIADVKQTIVDRLDSFEHALLSELSTMHLIKSPNVEKQDEKISKFIDLIFMQNL